MILLMLTAYMYTVQCIYLFAFNYSELFWTVMCSLDILTYIFSNPMHSFKDINIISLNTFGSPTPLGK